MLSYVVLFALQHVFLTNRLCEILMRELDIKDRTAKKYIAYMKEQDILIQDSQGNYQQRKTCLI